MGLCQWFPEIFVASLQSRFPVFGSRARIVVAFAK
jgi:hypothetical protein